MTKKKTTKREEPPSVRAELPRELHAAVIAKSERTGVRISHVIREALRRWVEQNGNGERKSD